MPCRIVISRLFYSTVHVSLRECFSRYLNDSSLSLYSPSLSLLCSMYILLLPRVIMRDKFSRRRRGLKQSMYVWIFETTEILHRYIHTQIFQICTTRANSWFVQGSREAILPWSYVCKARTCSRIEDIPRFLVRIGVSVERARILMRHFRIRGTLWSNKVLGSRFVRLKTERDHSLCLFFFLSPPFLFRLCVHFFSSQNLMTWIQSAVTDY